MLENIQQKWDTFDEKKKQNIKGFVILAIGSILIFSALVALKPDNEDKGIRPEEPNYQISEEKAKVEDVWLVESEQKISDISQELKNEVSKNQKLNKKLEELESKLDDFIESDETQYLRDEIEELKSQKPQQINNDNSQDDYSSSFTGQDSFSRIGKVSGGNNYNGSQKSAVPQTRSISIVDFGEDKKTKSYDLKEYIPAGSYAKAVLISSTDASVGLSSQGDPRPVLFRILSKAKSAIKDGSKQLETDVEGCTVTGAASGDLSSERVYIRLLKMSCAKGDKIVETSIEGYAADGSDGKAGIAGKVVSREGDLVAKSFVAGVVSGAGEGVSQKFQQGVTFRDGFSTSNNLSNKDIAGQGLGEGISKSSENLSEYLIQRAEQYQPVVSIASGKEVELVFISGAYLDGRIIPQANNNNNQSKQGSSSNINSYGAM